jgi:hypothetical protein
MLCQMKVLKSFRNPALLEVLSYLTQVHQVRVVDPHKMVSGKKFFVMLEMK